MCRPYSVLHPVGFTMPDLFPAPRCALAAPFRPYPSEGGRYAFCGTVPEKFSREAINPPPGITRHRSPVVPGLSSRLRKGSTDRSMFKSAAASAQASDRPALWQGAI